MLFRTKPSKGSNSTTSTSPPLALHSNTGFAVTNPDGTSTLYSYYQDTQGRVVENQYVGGAWTIKGSSVLSNAVVATDANPGSPIAATSWTSNGALFVSLNSLRSKACLANELAAASLLHRS